MSRGQIELDRAGILAALNDETGRKATTASILYQLAISDRMGLSLTDLVCGEILSRTGSITAGELAELSGLTTGAITGVVDRLERGGFVRRVNDPNDRRRVMLEPIHERFDRMSGNPYDALETRFTEVYAEYTDEELALLLDYARKSISIYDQETGRLRGQAKAPDGRERKPSLEPHQAERMQAQQDRMAKTNALSHDEPLLEVHSTSKKERRVFAFPRGNTESARLDWVSGPVHLDLRGVRGMPVLYRGEFRNDIPIVRNNEGVVSVQYRHRTLYGRGGGRAELDLNAATTWDLRFEIGASHLDADLSDLMLRGLLVKSKNSKISLLLPAPVGTLTVRIESGSSQIRIERPKNVPVRLELEGDVSNLRFDKERFKVSNEVRESPEYKRADQRYLIQIVGGHSKISVEEAK